MSENEFQVGKEVVFIDSKRHEEAPGWYPEVGTVGTIIAVLTLSSVFDLRIQWPKGSTSGTDIWSVSYEWIEPAHPDQGEIEKSDLSISFLLDVEV